MAVQIPRMKEFLFGLTIRTGSIVIAGVCLVTGILFVLPAFIYGFSGISEVEQGLIPPSIIDETSIKLTVGLTICACLIQVILSGLLLAGILKKNRCLMLPWLIISVITFILIAIGLFYYLIAPLVSGSGLLYSTIKFMFANYYIRNIITVLFSLVISAYATCIVYSYSAELREYQEVNKRQTQA